MVPSLFQNVTCSDLGYCVFLKQALAVISFFKAYSQFHCSHSYGDRALFVIKKVIAATHSFKFAVFLKNRYFSKEISQLFWYILDFRHAYIERSLLCDGIIPSHPFLLWQSHYFTGALEVIHMSKILCLFCNTCCNHPL